MTDTASYQVYRKETGEVVRTGEEIKDFRGDVYRFQAVSRAPSESSSGKITVTGGREFYPSVFKLEIRA